MENSKSMGELLEAVKLLMEKMERGELTISELSDLERLTAKLHERSIILKYKAFEKFAAHEKSDPDLAEEIHEETETRATTKETEESTENKEDEEVMEFSIFDEVEHLDEEHKDEEPLMPETKEQVIEEHRTISIKEEGPAGDKTMEVSITEKKESTFSERFHVEDNSIASKLSGGKINSLVGVFGLNERLRFINNLFDGSSEQFSEAVKVLDAQSNFSEAMSKINEMAAKHEWDDEDDSVKEFMNYLNRRYA